MGQPKIERIGQQVERRVYRCKRCIDFAKAISPIERTQPTVALLSGVNSTRSPAS